MFALHKAFVVLLVMPGFVPGPRAQSGSQLPSKGPAPAGAIAGRVTFSGKPAANVPVSLMSDPYSGVRTSNPGVNATTDADGRFRLTQVPPGRFYVAAFAPAYYSDEGGYLGGKAIDVGDGEIIEDLNIALHRGGVITGRLTDAIGRPLIQERIGLLVTGQQGARRPFYPTNARSTMTDDRGIYRVYGLPPGRYVVFAGTPTQGAEARMSVGSQFFPQTFYPSVSDQSQATELEVTEGSEAAAIDIVLGRTGKAYAVSGRIVDADTGKPVAGIASGYGSVAADGNYLRSTYFGGTANSRGEFRLDGVVPGKYVAVVLPRDDNQNYTYTPTPFEVIDSDISGVEIRLRRGASISGTLIVEGMSPQEAATQFGNIRIDVFVSPGIGTPRSSPPPINPDGSFRVPGLSAGKATISVHSLQGMFSKFIILRIEREGVEITDGIELGGGEEVAGIRLILGIGKGVIRGQIEFGDTPAGTRVIVSAHRVGDTSARSSRQSEADARGRFVLDNLMPGDYEVTARGIVMTPGVIDPRTAPGYAQKTVTVTNEADTQLTLVLQRAKPSN